MRVHIKTSPNTERVPYSYQVNLVGALHKWLGRNEVHDELSLYSLSWLSRGRAGKGGLNFPAGASYFVSSPDTALIKQLIQGIQAQPEIAFGLQVTDLMLQPPPEFGTEQVFFLQSPVLIKRQIGTDTKFYYPEDPESDQFLTETLTNKLKLANLGEKAIEVSFDRSYHSIKKKLATYKGIDNKGTLCPVIVKGDPEAVAFAWEVGVGNSTGIGFGALK